VHCAQNGASMTLVKCLMNVYADRASSWRSPSLQSLWLGHLPVLPQGTTFCWATCVPGPVWCPQAVGPFTSALNVSATWDGEGREGRLHFRSKRFCATFVLCKLPLRMWCATDYSVRDIFRRQRRKCDLSTTAGSGVHLGSTTFALLSFGLRHVGAVLIHLFEPPVHSVFRQGIWVQPYGMSKLRSQAETHNQWPKPGIEALTCRKVAA